MQEHAPVGIVKPFFVPVQLDDGTVIRIEATPTDDPDQTDEYVASIGLPSFEQFTHTVKSMAKSIASIWDEVQPSKASVEFNIEVGFETGNITAWLVKGAGKGHLTITMEWEKESSR